MAPSERDPLLAPPTQSFPVAPPRDLGVQNAGSSVNVHSQPTERGKKRPGPKELTRSQRWAILAGIWTAAFLSSLNATMVATLVTSISSEFERSHQASWLGTSYLLATSTFTPLYGRLSNVLGRRGANQTAILFAGLGTVACGLARNMEMLILGRFLAGVGGGGVFTTMSIITSDMYSMRDRSLTQGIANIFTGLGMGLGGPFGGFMADRFGWRWAFLAQAPLFILAFILTTYNLRYTTPGKSKGAVAVLKRIAYGGSLLLLCSVLSLLFFLSFKYNSDYPWSSPRVFVSLAGFFVGFAAFIAVELWVAPEPVMAPFLLRKRTPVLVSTSNWLVAFCNFSIQYFFPMWFETVALTTSSVAGLHLMPNSVSMSCGSLFAGWWLHRTGKYKTINVVFGILPTMAAVMIALLREDSNRIAMWLSIIPLGFGNATVLQTTLIALLASIEESATAVAIGFGQLWRGIGQVSGVAVSSAIFQAILTRELRARITGPDAETTINNIRHSAKLVIRLPPDLQRAARDSYGIALRAVFICAACSTFAAFLVRLPIPERSLDRDDDNTSPATMPAAAASNETASPAANGSPANVAIPAGEQLVHRPSGSLRGRSFGSVSVSGSVNARGQRRRLSTYESDYGADPEDEESGGSARPSRS